MVSLDNRPSRAGGVTLHCETQRVRARSKNKNSFFLFSASSFLPCDLEHFLVCMRSPSSLPVSTASFFRRILLFLIKLCPVKKTILHTVLSRHFFPPAMIGHIENELNLG